MAKGDPMRLADSPDTSSDTTGDTLRYVRGREAVLGNTVRMPLADPSIGAERLAVALGGRNQARRYLREALDALEPVAVVL